MLNRALYTKHQLDIINKRIAIFLEDGRPNPTHFLNPNTRVSDGRRLIECSKEEQEYYKMVKMEEIIFQPINENIDLNQPFDWTSYRGRNELELSLDKSRPSVTINDLSDEFFKELGKKREMEKRKMKKIHQKDESVEKGTEKIDDGSYDPIAELGRIYDEELAREKAQQEALAKQIKERDSPANKKLKEASVLKGCSNITIPDSLFTQTESYLSKQSSKTSFEETKEGAITQIDESESDKNDFDDYVHSVKRNNKRIYTEVNESEAVKIEFMDVADSIAKPFVEKFYNYNITKRTNKNTLKFSSRNDLLEEPEDSPYHKYIQIISVYADSIKESNILDCIKDPFQRSTYLDVVKSSVDKNFKNRPLILQFWNLLYHFIDLLRVNKDGSILDLTYHAFSSPNNNSTKTNGNIVLTSKILNSSIKFFEMEFYNLVKETVASLKGGFISDISDIEIIKAYIEFLHIDDIKFQKLVEKENNRYYNWAIVYYLFRCGLNEQALEYLRTLDPEINGTEEVELIEDLLTSFINREWITNDKKYKAIKVYNVHVVRKYIRPNPFFLILLRSICCLEPTNITIPEVIRTMDDVFWLQLTMASQEIRKIDSIDDQLNLNNSYPYTKSNGINSDEVDKVKFDVNSRVPYWNIEHVQSLVWGIGLDDLRPDADNPFYILKLLLLTGQFERIIQILSQYAAYEVDAMQLAFLFEHLGFIKVLKVPQAPKIPQSLTSEVLIDYKDPDTNEKSLAIQIFPLLKDILAKLHVSHLDKALSFYIILAVSFPDEYTSININLVRQLALEIYDFRLLISHNFKEGDPLDLECGFATLASSFCIDDIYTLYVDCLYLYIGSLFINKKYKDLIYLLPMIKNGRSIAIQLLLPNFKLHLESIPNLLTCRRQSRIIRSQLERFSQDLAALRSLFSEEELQNQEECSDDVKIYNTLSSLFIPFEAFFSGEYSKCIELYESLPFALGSNMDSDIDESIKSLENMPIFIREQIGNFLLLVIRALNIRLDSITSEFDKLPLIRHIKLIIVLAKNSTKYIPLILREKLLAEAKSVTKLAYIY